LADKQQRFKSKDTSIERGESDYSDKKSRLPSSRSQQHKGGSYGGLASQRSPQVTKNTLSSEEYAIEYIGTAKAPSSRNPQTILCRKEFKTQGYKQTESSSKLIDDGKSTARPSEYYKTFASVSDKDPSSVSSRNLTESAPSYKP
jgi:hypothetical protein